MMVVNHLVVIRVVVMLVAKLRREVATETNATVPTSLRLAVVTAAVVIEVLVDAEPSR